MPSSPLSLLTASERAALPRTEAPRTAQAMSATLARDPFSDPGWIFERKLDGIRCVAIRDGGPVRLLSRNDLSLNARFEEVTTALEAQPSRRFVVDGEIVAFSGAQTSFARLAARAQRAVTVHLYLFDVLWLDGCDVRPLALRERKRLLRAAVRFSDDTLRLSTHRNGDGEAYFRHACAHGWEGLVAKRADSPYVARRSRDWLKLKCEQGQELVVGGYTAPRGSRTEFGALLLGYHAGGALRYAGKVGTGFDTATLRSLGPAPARPGTLDEPVRRRRRASASAGCVGSPRSSWPSSRSRSGPRPGGCVIPASSACARTSPRPTWSASSRGSPSRTAPPFG